MKNANMRQRFSSWGFVGGGKFGDFPPDMPSTPILAHGGAAGVPDAVPGGHPDVFDPSVVTGLRAALAKEIGSDSTNPYIVGWSVGNEKDELIAISEVPAILALAASSPAKKAFVDHAYSVLYAGNLGTLASAWGITASTLADVYASKPKPPANDQEKLRLFYENAYYSALHQTVKSIDRSRIGNYDHPASR